MDSYDRSRAMWSCDGSIRLELALSSSGLSITLTSLCSAVAFFVGSSVDMPGISSFCIYAAWSFVANYILQFLLFVPLMVIDDRRIRKKRNFCCPCCCGHGGIDVDVQDLKVENMSPSKSTNSVDVSSGSAMQTEVSKKDSWLAIVLLPLMTRRIIRWLIIILFLCTLSGSMYVIPSVKAGSSPKNIVPDDSMILDFYDTLDTVWSGTTVFEQDVIIQNQDFSDIAVRDNVYELMAHLEAHDDALNAVANWLDEFASFLNATGQDMDTMDSSEFYSELQSFSNGTGWESAIIYDDDSAVIEMTRFTLSANGNNRLHLAWFEYLDWNDLFDEYFPLNSDGFIFNVDSLLGYILNTLLSVTATNMLFAGIGVFCVLIAFLDLRMAVFMAVVIAMIDVHLMGWIWAFDITLDLTVHLICVMAVGLTVDYLIHITHSIAEARPEGMGNMDHHSLYEAKLRDALNSMGVSVWYVPSALFLGMIRVIYFTVL